MLDFLASGQMNRQAGAPWNYTNWERQDNIEDRQNCLHLYPNYIDMDPPVYFNRQWGDYNCDYNIFYEGIYESLVLQK